MYTIIHAQPQESATRPLQSLHATSKGHVPLLCLRSHEEGQEERGPFVVVPYVAGMSEDIRHVRRKFNISETTPLKKLDWNVTDEQILFEQVRRCLGSQARGR